MPWLADPVWDALAYTPQGAVWGTYRVDLTELGFIAHGYMDADGDGVSAHMVVIVTPAGVSPPELLTPTNVY